MSEISESGNFVTSGALVPVASGNGLTSAGDSFRQIVPALVIDAGEKAALSFVNFFTAQIENPNTRAAYMSAWREFGIWATENGVQLVTLQPHQVARYRQALSQRYHPRSVKLYLSAIRRLCDQMVIDHVIAFNPASSVKSPRFSANRGVTPVLSPEETRQLFDAVDLGGSGDGDGEYAGARRLVGLRDRAILALMVYTVGRITAVVQMQVKDFYQDRRKWKVRLHEKGGKLHEVWCHHNLGDWLQEYVEVAGIARERDSPLFRSTRGRSGILTERGMCRQDMGAMVKRRCKDAGIEDRFSPHSFRATGITLYMANGGSLAEAQKLANHADPRTTKLYDHSSDEVGLDEIERIRF